MNPSDTLKIRLDEVEIILKSTKEFEKRQRSNVKRNAQNKRLIASLRATTYVMLYNALEEAMRSIMRSIREKIEGEGINFFGASDFWRLDALQAALLDKLQAGTNHGQVLVDTLPLTNSPLFWDEIKKGRLPFSGNFGQLSAMKLRDDLAMSWTAPASTLGGSDLENIRERRNALAHGLESFEEAGGKVTASDLLDVLKRVRSFMISFVEALEQYRDDRAYLRLQVGPVGIASNPAGTPGSSSTAQPPASL